MANRPTEVQQDGGNLNDGQEYERKVLLFIAASLSQNKAVKTFWIVSNPTEIDKIDDVVVGVSFEDSRKADIALFVQVKHTKTIRKSLWLKLNDKDKKPTPICYPINLTEYKNAFEDLIKMMSSVRPKSETALQTLLNGIDVKNYFVCIVTNMQNVSPKLVCKQFYEDHPLYFLNIRNRGKYRHFDYENNAKFNTNFYKQLYIFIGQPDSKDMDNTIAHVLGEDPKQIPYLDKVIKDFMQRDLFCGVLTKQEFESKLCEVVVNYWMVKDKKFDIIIENHIELWNKILSGEEIVNLCDNKIAALLAYHYQSVIRQEVDKRFDWQEDVTKLTKTIIDCIQQKYNKNVTDVNDLLILLWRENKIPLAVKPEYTPNILSFLQKFKTLKRKFVIFCSEHSHELKEFSSTESVITYVREISDNKTLEKIFDLEVSLEGRRPVALKRMSGVPIETAIKGIYKDLTISQVLAWTEKSENIQHIIGPQLRAPDDKYITRYFTQKGEEERKLTQEAVLERVGPRLHIITGEPGMGKSKVLEALAYCYSPKTFVIYLKLGDCLKDIDDDDVLQKIERDPILYFYNKMTNNTDDKITRSIMDAHKTSKHLCLFLDGFDEMLPFHGWRISSLIEEILINTDIPIFCTTRPHAENKIIISTDRTIYFKLLPFDYEHIIKYFTKTNIITEDIILRFDLEFLGNALHLNMISQIKIHQEDIDDFTIGNIYKRFIELKYKETYNKRGCGHNDVYLPTLKSMKMHRVLAMADIFGKEDVISKELISDTGLAEILSEIYHIGIGYVRNSDKSFQFLHKTYSEYFVADWLLHNMAQHVSNTKYLKHFHKKIWEQSAYLDISTMIIELTRNYDLWLEIRKYFFINSDYENKSSTCNCNGYEGWLKCTMSHPNVSGSSIVDSINRDYPTRMPLSVDVDTCTKLLTAIQAENEADVQLNLSLSLLDTGVGTVAFNCAITTGNDRIVGSLLTVRPKLVNEQNVNGNTGLHISCACGYTSIAALLFNKGAKFAIINKGGMTPLGMATKNKQWRIWMMRHIGEISKRSGEHGHVSSEEYETFSNDISEAVLMASRNYKWAIVKQLLQHDADPALPGEDGWTPIHFAAKSGELKNIEMLFERSVGVNTKTKLGETPLTIAYKYGKTNIAEWLLNHGAVHTLPIDDGRAILGQRPAEVTSLVPRVAGNLNDGMVYERKVLLFIAASLSQNEEVDQFWIVSYPAGLDKFDDVVARVSFKDSGKKDIAMFFQVKLTSRDKLLWLSTPTNKKRPAKFCYEIKITEYEKEFDKVIHLMSSNIPQHEGFRNLLMGVDVKDYFVCIFTNMNNVSPELQSKQFDAAHPIYFVDTKKCGQYRQFAHEKEKLLSNFYEQLYIFLGQYSFEEIDLLIAELLGGDYKNRLADLEYIVTNYMLRSYYCCVLTKPAFEMIWFKVLAMDWMYIDLETIAENNVMFKSKYEKWQKILAGQNVINLLEDKMWPLVAYHYQCVIIKEVDENFDWQKGMTLGITNSIKQKYRENVNDLKELLFLLWRENKIPLAIKPEYTPDILSHITKFKTLGRRFVIFCSDDSTVLKEYSLKELVTTYEY